MKAAWLGCALFCSLLSAGTQDPEFNVNSQYTVETVIVSGDGWSTDLAAADPIPNQKISFGLRRQIAALIGSKLDAGLLDQLSSKLRREFQANAVTHRVLRGANPEYVRVIFEIELRPTHFDVAVPKFLYNSRDGASGAIEGTATEGNNAFTLGAVSDGDLLAERYSGVVARYGNSSLGTDRVHFQFEAASYKEEWNPATQQDSAVSDSELYRTREHFEPVLTFVLAKPLALSVGTDWERLEGPIPAAQMEAANALVSALRYHQVLEGSEGQQEIDAVYDVRAASRVLGSDFVYTRHHWGFRYTRSHGKHTVSDNVTAGVILGNAPLFERYVLGNSTTLRGWDKYEIDPAGGNRVVANSVEYRYGCFQAFYDSGAVWDSGQTAILRHSAGMGVREGPLFVAVAFPLGAGHTDPIVMVGMNY
jgi:hypothetical protein